MTCIVGLVNNLGVWIGADSASIDSYWTVSNRKDKKIFQNSKFLIGYTTSFRMGQLLYCANLNIEHPPKMNNFMFMVSKFIPVVKKSLQDGDWEKKQDNRAEGGEFLVGYKGELYQIDTDFQVQWCKKYSAAGCGEQVALGSLYSTRDIVDDGPGRLKMALQAAAAHNCGVRTPFTVQKLL